MTPVPRRDHFRDPLHHAVAVVTEAVSPALRLAARAMSRTAPSAPATWERALIVGHGHIGDVLCQTVSLDALSRALPSCAFEYLTTPLAAEVLRGNPSLAAVLPLNTAPRPDAVTPDAVRELRAREYDAVLCTNVVRHHEGLRLALRLGIPNRVAFAHRGLSGLTTIPIWLPRPMTPPAQSRFMAETLGGVPDSSELRPRIYPTRDDVHAAAAERARLGFTADDTVIACAVTTRQVIGHVPPSFFAAVLGALQRVAPDIRVVLTGSGDDARILAGVAEMLPGSVSISAGRLSLRAFAAFLGHTNAFFGMDSGPRHLANAAGGRVMFVRNMAVRAAEAGAYCPSEEDIAPPGDFLDRDQIVRALDTIDTAAVAHRLASIARSR